MNRHIILFTLLLSFPASSIWGQNSVAQTAQYEAELDRLVREHPLMVDVYPDSVWYDNASYIFCRSPLYQRNGYTAIFSDYFNGEAVGYGWPRGGWRGYRLVWRIRNDSLFIQTVYKIKDLGEIDAATSKDDIIHSMEDFVGNKFTKRRKPLMFVNWVSGDFRLLTNEPPGADIAWNEDIHPLEAGFTFTFENGVLKDVRKNVNEVVYYPETLKKNRSKAQRKAKKKNADG